MPEEVEGCGCTFRAIQEVTKSKEVHFLPVIHIFLSRQRLGSVAGPRFELTLNILLGIS